MRIIHSGYALPRVLLGSVFLLAASHKLLDPGAMAKMVSYVPWIPPMRNWQAAFLGGAMAGWEVFLGLWCVRVSKRMWPAAIASWITLGVFTLAVGPIFAATGGSCGCAWEWMPIQAHSTLGLLVRNLALGLLAMAGILGDELRRRDSPFCRVPAQALA